MNLMVYNGMASFLTLEVWQVMLILEIATVLIETVIIGAYWKLKQGKIRWYWLLTIIGVANAVTAWMGIAVYDGLKEYLYEGTYHILMYDGFSSEPTAGTMLIFVITTIFVMLAVLALMIILKTGKEEDSSSVLEK